MKVILNEYVPNLGEAGEKVSVAPGYARNFLLPRKLAFEATGANVKTYENNLAQRARKLSKMFKEAEAQKALLEGVGVLEFIRKSGESGKLFGSVTTSDIGEALAAKGFDIDKRKIALANPIKTLGEASAYIKLHPKVTAEVKLSVKQEEPPAPPAEPEMGAEAPALEQAAEQTTAEEQAPSQEG